MIAWNPENGWISHYIRIESYDIPLYPIYLHQKSHEIPLKPYENPMKIP